MAGSARARCARGDRAVVATAHAGTDLATVVQTCGLLVQPGDGVCQYSPIGSDEDGSMGLTPPISHLLAD